MRLGIVGPIYIANRAHSIIKKYYPTIELLDIIYSEYIEAPSLVEKHQTELDAILFLGKTPYKLSEKLVKQIIIWEYTPRHGSTLLRTLLEASILKKCDITSVSFDTYSRDLLYEAYEEIGFNKRDLRFFIAEQKLTESNYLDYIYRFHCNNYYSNKVSCCITGLMEIYNKLDFHNIPCALAAPINNVILSTVERIWLKYLANCNRNNQIVVMVIQIDFPNEYSVVKDDEYQNIINRMKISECVYFFASKIKAAVVEINYKEYMIFTTKKIIETETNNYQNIYFFELIEEKTLRTVSLGIGYGDSAQDAKFNAYSGLNKAIGLGGNTGFVVYENAEVKGPLKKKTEKHQKILDKKLSNISEQTEISINTLFKIYDAAQKCNNNTFSSKELAALCDISQRSMDRFLQKLEAHEFCVTVGKKMMNDTGRASRIMKLTFF